jgi:hypothetical protein
MAVDTPSLEWEELPTFCCRGLGYNEMNHEERSTEKRQRGIINERAVTLRCPFAENSFPEISVRDVSSRKLQSSLSVRHSIKSGHDRRLKTFGKVKLAIPDEKSPHRHRGRRTHPARQRG